MNNNYPGSRFSRRLRNVRNGLAVLLGWWPLLSQAQAPANDDPCGALALPLLGSLCTTPTTGTNAGATTTAANGYFNPGSNGQVNGCGQSTSPKDVWFKFTTASTGLASFGATVTVSGSPAGLLRLFSAPSCAGPFTSIQCTGGTTNNSVAGRLTTAALSPSTTYYVQVAGYGSNDVQGPFTICVTDGPGAPECLPVSNIAISYTAAGLQPDQGILSFTPGANNVPPYTVTLSGGGASRSFNTMASPVLLSGLAPGSSQTALISSACSYGGTASTAYPLNVPARNGFSCDALPLAVNPTCLSVAGDLYYGNQGGPGCGQASAYKKLWYKFTTAASGPASTQATVSLNSSTGANELQVWSGNGTSCNSNTFTLLGCSVPTTAGGATTPLTFTTLTPATTYYVQVGNSRFASATGTFTVCVTAPGGCSAPRLNVDNITGTSAVVNFSTLVTAAAPTGYTLTYQAAAGPLQTLSPAPSAPAAALTGLLPGTTYTVTLTANCDGGGVSAPATFTFTTAATAPSCAQATGLSITNVTGNAATLSFTPAAGATGYAISYQAAGSSPQVVTPAPTTSPVQLTGLLPGTTYAVLLQATCAGGSSTTQTVTFTTPALTASNDNCATAVVLPVGTVCQYTRVTTAGATAGSGAPAPTCATSSTLYDVWGQLTVPANGIVQVTTGSTGNVSNTAMAIYSGTCGSLTQLDCNDDYAGGGNFSQLRLTGQTPGATLYVRLWALGVGSTGGVFQVCAQTDATPLPTASAALSGSVAVYPNPAHTAFVVQLPAALAATAAPASLYNSLGQLVRQVTFSGTEARFAIGGLAPGVYVLRLATSEGPVTKRLLVE
ncbi:fibronectin type III domain-containing protein [Hymenobacter ruricola]|uniref:Fibronectin type III domain-containing protein n=1 Tax=Hymenobacter ruricola TaxID=2791023 RepID=A0ABS0HYD3_9BACT|nr:fibronectin type III domain-containing protein [Hymenobacter ruricola]MBF9219695.1 fibronectin type III domain-containing protein [Hymenobacter ruricola]